MRSRLDLTVPYRILQPSGATPNSGLNRKEKEEERKKELHKMRDDARAKRAEEAVSNSNTFTYHPSP